MASVWMAVTMLSTPTLANITHTAQRKEKDGSGVSVQCTDVLVLYNKYNIWQVWIEETSFDSTTALEPNA